MTATTTRLEVLWSPCHKNKFITWGNEICLYDVKTSDKNHKPTDIKTSDNTVAQLQTSNTSYRYVKCVDIYPRSEPDFLLAVGQANGKVSLATFGATVFDSLGLSGLDLGPKYSRQCNIVKWNPNESNLLLCGFEKHRSDHSILLWDVVKSQSDKQFGTQFSASKVLNSDYVRPLLELGLADTVHSLAWFNQSQNNIVIGYNNRCLKILDVRDATSALYTQSTKAVYGVDVAPYDNSFIVSYGDNQIAVWDSRNFDKPILTLTQAKFVSKVQWCPTRRNLIGSLQKESCAIHLHDMQQSMEENEPSVLWRSIEPSQESALTSFSWHPKHENRLISVSVFGEITDFTIFERMTLNWSPNSHVVWTFGQRYLKLVSDQDKMYSKVEQLTPLIKRRALMEHGLKPELWQNGSLSEDEVLEQAWQWLHISKKLVEENTVQCAVPVKHPGIRNVLGIYPSDHSLLQSERTYINWHDLSTPVLRYKSPCRDYALSLCGWKTQDSTEIDRLELEGTYSKAATLAIFNLQLRLAIDILNKAATRDPYYAVIAMALSGYSNENQSLWKDLCISSKDQLQDPYLKAAFSFLVDQSETYEQVLGETSMLIDDRVAFACMYLSDADLIEYITHLTEVSVEEGDITGLLLTGTTDECVPLLQKYLENTGDIQTVSLISVRTFMPDLLYNDFNVQSWIESYRCLLDSWKMWNQRAKFDIFLNAYKIPTQQVFVTCSFCGKSVSAFMLEKHRKFVTKQSSDANPFNYHGLRVYQDEIKSCPNCHKPLPKCSVCLSSMGSQSIYLGPEKEFSVELSENRIKSSEYKWWFTWCQTCRHGGHAEHLLLWFKEHVECPVSGCSCTCLSLDDL